MAKASAMCTAAESAVSDDSDCFAEAGTYNVACGREHLLHTRAALGPLVTNHYNIALFDLAG